MARNKDVPIWSEEQKRKVENFLRLKSSIRSTALSPRTEELKAEQSKKLRKEVEEMDLFDDARHHLRFMLTILFAKQ